MFRLGPHFVYISLDVFQSLLKGLLLIGLSILGFILNSIHRRRPLFIHCDRSLILQPCTHESFPVDKFLLHDTVIELQRELLLLKLRTSLLLLTTSPLSLRRTSFDPGEEVTFLILGSEVPNELSLVAHHCILNDTQVTFTLDHNEDTV